MVSGKSRAWGRAIGDSLRSLTKRAVRTAITHEPRTAPQHSLTTRLPHGGRGQDLGGSCVGTDGAYCLVEQEQHYGRS